jgi:hypothetical protein
MTYVKPLVFDVFGTLVGWPDVAQGLAVLRQQFVLGPCSNGHIALMANLARHNERRWDTILGAELARDYEPKAVVYTMAAAVLDMTPHEYGPNTGEPRVTVPVDFEASDLRHLARLLRLE